MFASPALSTDSTATRSVLLERQSCPKTDGWLTDDMRGMGEMVSTTVMSGDTALTSLMTVSAASLTSSTLSMRHLYPRISDLLTTRTGWSYRNGCRATPRVNMSNLARLNSSRALLPSGSPSPVLRTISRAASGEFRSSTTLIRDASRPRSRKDAAMLSAKHEPMVMTPLFLGMNGSAGVYPGKIHRSAAARISTNASGLSGNL